MRRRELPWWVLGVPLAAAALGPLLPAGPPSHDPFGAPACYAPFGRPWDSPADYPEGMEPYVPGQHTQELATVDGRPRVTKVPTPEEWTVSGGMAGLTGWKSAKFRLVPGGAPTKLVRIEIENGLGSTQEEWGLAREYPDGTRFDDVLSTARGVFEHRSRAKEKGRWTSRVLYSDPSARPEGYSGLKASCASCHDRAGTGGYGEALVPGSDTVLSDPPDWRAARRYLEVRR